MHYCYYRNSVSDPIKCDLLSYIASFFFFFFCYNKFCRKNKSLLKCAVKFFMYNDNRNLYAKYVDITSKAI